MKPFDFVRGGVTYSFTPLPTMAEKDVLALVPEYKAITAPVKSVVKTNAENDEHVKKTEKPLHVSNDVIKKHKIVNINTDSEADIAALPLFGIKTAANIFKARQTQKFTDLADVWKRLRLRGEYTELIERTTF